MSDASLFDMQAFGASSTGGSASPSATHSLYRKYRPSTFADDDLVGQEHVVNTLRNAITLNRISHAYLFCGPRGTGKTTTARLLAKAVNCLDPDPRNRPCNECAACVAINTNATTDVIEIDAASNRGIDDIRDLRERVKYAPSQLKTKFYIIDEAHQITGAAANAFLKTLEEPPAHTRFVLATTDPEELLQTIVSRCQRFDFRRINIEAMLARLRTVADFEHIDIEDDALPVIARQATGSLRDALGMLDQVAVYRESAADTAETITAEMVRSVLGVSRNERVEVLARSLADKDPAAGLREISAAVDAGDDIRQLGRQLVTYIRMLLLEKAGGSADADATAKEIAQKFSLNELAAIVRQLSEVDFRARRSAFPQLPLEIAIVEASQRGQAPQVAQAAPVQVQERPTFRSTEEPAYLRETPPDYDEAPAPMESQAPRTSLKDRVRGKAPAASPMTPRPQPTPSSVSSRPEPSPVQAPAPAKSQERSPITAAGPTNDGSLNLESLLDRWPKIRADVKALNRRIEALLLQVDPAAVNGNQVILVSPYDFHRNRINSDEVRQVIESVVERIFGTRVTVTCMSKEEAQLLGGSKPTQVADIPRPSAPEPPAQQSDGNSAQSAPDASPDTQIVEVADAEGAPNLSEADLEARIKAAKNIFDAEEVFD